MKGFSVVLSVGTYGGFYAARGLMPRLNLGWFSITLLRQDFESFVDDVLAKLDTAHGVTGEETE